MSQTNANAIILDLGSGRVKAGFSGQDTPKVCFDSFVGRPKFKKLLGRDEKIAVIGPSRETRGLFKLTRLVKRGQLVEEESRLLLQKVWEDLKIKDSTAPLFVTEPPFSPLQQKLEFSRYLVEKKNISSIFFGTQAILSLYAFGKTDGLVLESGDGVTQVVPIYNGYKLDHAVERINFGGEDVSNYLKMLLRKNGNNINASNEICLFDEMKRGVIELLPNAASDSDAKMEKRKAEEVRYELPDGDVIPIKAEKFQAAEILFNPALASLEFMGLHELIDTSIKKLDLDLRKNMYRNFYVSGGNTMIAGFPERLGNELAPLVYEKAPISIVAANVDRTLLAWQGGSVVSQLTSFQNLWISKKDFDEFGERIFLNKSF